VKADDAELSTMALNGTVEASQPDLGKPQFASHTWLEPIVSAITTGHAMYVNEKIDRGRHHDWLSGHQPSPWIPDH